MIEKVNQKSIIFKIKKDYILITLQKIYYKNINLII